PDQPLQPLPWSATCYPVPAPSPTPYRFEEWLARTQGNDRLRSHCRPHHVLFRGADADRIGDPLAVSTCRVIRRLVHSSRFCPILRHMMEQTTILSLSPFAHFLARRPAKQPTPPSFSVLTPMYGTD